MRKITLLLIAATLLSLTVIASFNKGYTVGIQQSAVDVPVFEDSVTPDDEEVCSVGGKSVSCEANQD